MCSNPGIRFGIFGFRFWYPFGCFRSLVQFYSNYFGFLIEESIRNQKFFEYFLVIIRILITEKIKVFLSIWLFSQCEGNRIILFSVFDCCSVRASLLMDS